MYICVYRNATSTKNAVGDDPCCRGVMEGIREKHKERVRGGYRDGRGTGIAPNPILAPHLTLPHISAPSQCSATHEKSLAPHFP